MRIVPDPVNAGAGYILTISAGGNVRDPHRNLVLLTHLISVGGGLGKYRVYQTTSESGRLLSRFGGGFVSLLSRALSLGRV